MSGIWNYSLRARGTEEAIEKFLSYTYAFGNKPECLYLDFSEIFDARVERKNGWSYATFYCGNSKGPWSELIYAEDAYPNTVSLIEISEKLGLLIEMFVDCDDNSSHLIIDCGREQLDECREKYDPVWENGVYETFEDWRQEYNMPEGTTLKDVLEGENAAYGAESYNVNMTWDEFVEYMEPFDGECFHFGGFVPNWTI